jgi:hypothetical protein
MLRALFRKYILVVVALFALPSAAHANILFEGWFEVMLGAKKIGYSVERYEFVNNQFKCVTYVRTNSEGNNVTESLKATSGPDLAPQSYAYTSKAGDKVKVIDASFKGDQMILSIFDGKTTKKETKRIKKGTFLSTFLLYLILQQKTGLKVGSDYKYNAIAEEEGTAYTGSALVKDEEPVRGKKAFRILNEFKSEKFFSWISTKGEPLLIRQPDSNIDVRGVETQAAATKDMAVNANDLKLLFGRLPDEGSTDEKPNLKSSSTGKTKGKKNKSGGDDSSNGADKTSDDKNSTGSAPSAPDSSSPTSKNGVQIKGVPPPKDEDTAPPSSH